MALNVVYVDDEGELCEIFADFFTSKDVGVTAFTDAKQAIDHINKNNVDLVFLDFRLPGIRGDELAKEIPDHIPRYLLTGELDVKTIVPFKEILRKPYDIEKIVTIINAHKRP
jgi:DNA-binding NtrC family response regulator